MEPFSEDQLIEELRALRPTPHPEFAAELDERAAAGFPRRSHWRWTPFERLRSMQPRKLLIPAGCVAVLAIAVATVVTVSNDSGDEAQSGGMLSLLNEAPPSSTPEASDKPSTGYEYEGEVSSSGKVAPSAAGAEIQEFSSDTT